MDNNNLVSQCRLCSADFQHGVLVFSEEGKRLYLQAKIRKYLYITVSMEDIFPKIVCDNCCKKLDGIHKFATMAVKNQDKFSKFVSETTNCSSTEPKRGLLHTYLTKGITEKQAEDTEEMEVRVDPMLFLQCNSEETRSEEDDEEENMSDIAPELEQHTNFKTPSLEQIENEDSYSKEYKCSMCSRVFHTEYSLQNHTWCHLPKNRRVVLNNHNNFYLKVERVDEDGNKDEHSAEAQQMSTYDESGENANGLRFSCPICGKIISTKGNLKVHLETHRPKGKYGCDICGRIFKTQCNLHRHKEYHSGIQFTCAVCGRVYPTNSTLRAHSITHSDLRPHKCPLCDKTFKRNQDLKFHINQHTGARPYQCPYCPKAFASSGNCFSHRKRMHPLEVERDRERAAKIMR